MSGAGLAQWREGQIVWITPPRPSRPGGRPGAGSSPRSSRRPRPLLVVRTLRGNLGRPSHADRRRRTAHRPLQPPGLPHHMQRLAVGLSNQRDPPPAKRRPPAPPHLLALVSPGQPRGGHPCSARRKNVMGLVVELATRQPDGYRPREPARPAQAGRHVVADCSVLAARADRQRPLAAGVVLLHRSRLLAFRSFVASRAPGVEPGSGAYRPRCYYASPATDGVPQ